MIFLFEAQLWAFYNFTLHVLKISPNLRIDVLIYCLGEGEGVDFAQICVVDYRQKSKNVVESTERLTPLVPPS